MLVKANLINGESKIIAIEGNDFDKISGTLLDKALKWYSTIMHTPYEITCMNIPEEFLKHNGISNIETLSFDEEIKIQEKLNLQGGTMLNKKYGGGYIDNSNLETLRNNPPGDPPRQPISHNNVQVYSINDLVLLKDRDIITQEEFKRLAREMVGL